MADPTKAPEHGTRGGYNKHLRRGETPCDPCRAAAAAQRRARRAEGKERDQKYARARSRALTRLGQIHYTELLTLIAVEMEAER